MNVEVTPLPGIGVCKHFPLTNAPRCCGVIDHTAGDVLAGVGAAEGRAAAATIVLDG
ncbi:hypothetical protein [Nocardia sp. CNY236]|uniref:hypothetical protein n=1 Tax=Nocardia sp. CNY236 TaxID=1169152 RepID=UPI00040ADDA0|nr:hypothetical protein [Nocardia sp. CNY236]